MIVTDDKYSLVITGGGTGGHIFPGLAIGESWLRLVPRAAFSYIGSARGMEKEIVTDAGYSFHGVQAVGLNRRPLGAQILSLPVLGRGLAEAVALLRKIKPVAVISTGGYASAAASISAIILSIPLFVLEPNSVAGFTNRVFGRFARMSFTAFRRTTKQFPGQAVQVTGVPLRLPKKETLRGQLNFGTAGELRILVIGGSQGAHSLNKAVPSAAKYLEERGIKFEIIHQSGKAGYEQTVGYYQRAGARAQICPFLKNIPELMSAADVIIMRAGAVSLAEASVHSRASLVIVPFPYSAGGHQEQNALEYQENGAAMVVTEGPDFEQSISRSLGKLSCSPDLRKMMAENLAALAKPNAADDIAKYIATALGIQPRDPAEENHVPS